MASISRDANGTKRVLFTDGDGERRAVRLGDVSVKAAEDFQRRIEALLQDKELHRPHDVELATWLSRLSDRMYARLVRVELVEPREKAEAVTLEKLLTAFFAAVDVKPSTLVRMKQAETALVTHFGPDRNVATIHEADAEAWRAKLKELGYAPATISRTVLYARQVFRWAMRLGKSSANPFANLKAGAQVNAARSVFVDRATIAKVIDAAPDAEWRLVIALSRFGGLRVPSEALSLRWTDIDWEHNRITVRSSKTEHHEGRSERMVPLFPEIREHLQAVFDAAPEGAVNVIGRYREGSNLNPHLRRIIKAAGLTPWPRTWHNLRASRQTELAASFPLATVCAWIGNTKAIAAGHYLQVTDADWTRATAAPESGAKSGAHSGHKAAHNAAQHVSAANRTDSREHAQPQFDPRLSQAGAPERDAAQLISMGRPGLEQSQKPAENTRVQDQSGADSGAPSAGIGPDQGQPSTGEFRTEDPELVQVAQAWPHLPVAIRAGVLAMVRAAANAADAGGRAS